MRAEAIDLFFSTARERYNILLRRQAGEAVWTTDPVFLGNRFCNVFREHDKTTMWFKEHIREPLRDRPADVLLATVAFRWFNRIETWQTILSGWEGAGPQEVFANWDSAAVKECLTQDGKAPWVTGAYIIKTPDGMNKLDGVLWCIEQVAPHVHQLAFQINDCNSLQRAVNRLIEFPYLGPFMAYQIVCDLKSTCLLERATDRMTWAQVGPGSTRGLGRIHMSDPNFYSRGSAADREHMLRDMRCLLELSEDNLFWPERWPRWEMSDIQHWLCEYDKYCRVLEGGRMKQTYKRDA